MCAHTYGKIGIFTRRVYSAYIFDSYPLPLFRRLTVGAAIEKNFFYFLFFWFVIVLVWFWLSDYRLIISIFNLHILTRFGYAWLSYSTRLIFARYSLSVLCYIFTRINFDLFQHCLFYALTLQLFNSPACYKQTSMLMQSLFYAYFVYFKASWRVFVCFRCSLSSWDKIMRQKA